MAETVGIIIFQAIGLSAAAAFTIGATSITLATVIGTVALAAGAIGLQYLTAQQQQPGLDQDGPSSQVAPEKGHQALRQAIGPRIVGYGRNRLAGVYVLYEEKDGVSYDVLALHHGRLAAFIGYYLHDDVVEIDGDGIVDEQGDSRYGGNTIKIKTRLGVASETAYSEITTPLASVWTSAHKGNGIASLALICGAVSLESYTTIFPRGKPEPSVVADCAPIFDPRDDTQSRADETTWKVSSNPVLQVIDQLTNADRGMGLAWDTLIAPVLDALMHEADLCDELVLKADGSTEPRYESDGTFSLDTDPADILNSIVAACDGWYSQNGDGSLALKVGVYRHPSLTLTADHIRGFQLQKGVADEEIVNELMLDYTEPQLDYKTAPGQPWRDETSIAEQGRVRSQRFAVPWVQSHSQGRRLAKRRMAQLNAPLRGLLVTTLYGLRPLGERWIRIAAGDAFVADFADLVIEVKGITIDLLNATLTINFASVNPNEIDAWVAAEEEGSRPAIPAKLIVPPPPIPANLDADYPAIGPGGVVGVNLRFDDPGRSDLHFQARYRISGSGSPYTESAASLLIDSTTGGRSLIIFIQAFAAGTYEIGLRSFGPAGAGSAYSVSDTFTVP